MLKQRTLTFHNRDRATELSSNSLPLHKASRKFGKSGYKARKRDQEKLDKTIDVRIEHDEEKHIVFNNKPTLTLLFNLKELRKTKG